jgi:hypothetical protein
VINEVGGYQVAVSSSWPERSTREVLRKVFVGGEEGVDGDAEREVGEVEQVRSCRSCLERGQCANAPAANSTGTTKLQLAHRALLQPTHFHRGSRLRRQLWVFSESAVNQDYSCHRPPDAAEEQANNVAARKTST